jgi:hypothetical protein
MWPHKTVIKAKCAQIKANLFELPLKNNYWKETETIKIICKFNSQTIEKRGTNTYPVTKVSTK